MPGIFSARWSGRHGDDAANLALVLAQLADVTDPHRSAHFACAAALALPDGREHVVEGRLDGKLVGSPRGSGGFGYDPIFLPDGASLTTAEMAPEAKDAISHRGRAFRALAAVLARGDDPRYPPARFAPREGDSPTHRRSPGHKGPARWPVTTASP